MEVFRIFLVVRMTFLFSIPSAVKRSRREIVFRDIENESDKKFIDFLSGGFGFVQQTFHGKLKRGDF